MALAYGRTELVQGVIPPFPVWDSEVKSAYRWESLECKMAWWCEANLGVSFQPVAGLYILGIDTVIQLELPVHYRSGISGEGLVDGPFQSDFGNPPTSSNRISGRHSETVEQIIFAPLYVPSGFVP